MEDEWKQQIKDIHKILTGNGNPEQGLVYKVAITTEFMNFWKRIGWLILAAIVSPSILTLIVLAVFTNQK